MSKTIENIEQNCLICNQFCKNRRSLVMHIARSHKEITSKIYVEKFILNSEIPLCKCGCNKQTTWHYGYLKYSDYLPGHNDAGFRVKQPIFTQDQIDKRNDAIRKTYDEKHEEICNKISESVTVAFQDPQKKQNLIEGQKLAWDSEERKEQASSSQKVAWSGEAGEIRREKVFTPEFGQKISIANMNRDVKKTSKAQEVFTKNLEDIFGKENVESNKWFNFETKTWCADVWIKSENVIVEFDGLYWHALDRNDNFDFNQVTNILNDLTKNSLAKEKSLNLIRVKENTNINNVKSMEDLIDIAYHVVLSGKVIKEGTFKINDIDTFELQNNKERYDELIDLHNKYWNL
jgi:hypothetical protein